MSLLKEGLKPAGVTNLGSQAFRRSIQMGKAVSMRRKKYANGGDGITSGVSACRTHLLLVCQSKLIALVGCIETKHRFCKTWEIGTGTLLGHRYTVGMASCRTVVQG